MISKEITDATSAHEGFNWEVLLVDEPDLNAFCGIGGKIVVCTGLLEHFKTDAEIATIIGHEVAHVAARHYAEIMTNILFTPIFSRLFFQRREEMEADYIGMLLIAAAGYDPRVAPTVYEKLGKLAGDSAFQDLISTPKPK